MSSHGILNPQIPPHIAQITGPLLLGYFFNWLLLGVLTVQCYIYYLAFWQDDLFHWKIAVAVIYVLETLQLILCTKDAFSEFATGFGNTEALGSIGLLWFSLPLLSALIACIVQTFYAWHIRTESRQMWLFLVIFTLSLAQCGAGIYDGVVAVHLGDLQQFSLDHLSSTTFRMSASVACDLVITTSMLYYFVITKPQPRTRSSHGTHDIVPKVSKLIVESNLLCTIIAVIELGLYLGFRGTTYHYTPGLALAKLYSNSMLAVLNSRLPFSVLFQSELQGKIITSTRVSFAPGPNDGLSSTRLSSSRSPQNSSQATSTTRAASYISGEVIELREPDLTDLEADLPHERRRLRTGQFDSELS